MVTTTEVEKLHDAAKIIEYDGAQGYYACVEKFGVQIANAMLVAFLRRSFGPVSFPEQEGLREKVNEHLASVGILKDVCPHCGK